MSSPTDLQILSRLATVELKMRRLIEELALANRRLATAVQEAGELRSQNRALQLQLREVQKKEPNPVRPFPKSDKSRKLVENYYRTSDNPAELKEQIDRYIREIDQCIAYLSSSPAL